MSINRVCISGNLTRDPELRSTQSGMAVLGFSVAVNERRKNAQTGEWEDHPNFVDCTMFGERARGLSGYLTKGAKVAVEGRLRQSQWEDSRSGQKRSKIEVVVDEIEFMSRREAQQPACGSQGGYAPAYGQQAVYEQLQPAYAPAYAQQPAYAPQPVPPHGYDAGNVADEPIPF